MGEGLKEGSGGTTGVQRRGAERKERRSPDP